MDQFYTIAGQNNAEYAGDGGPASEASLDYPARVAFDAAGNLYIGDGVRKVDTDGIITTHAGTGTSGYSGDGGLATDATLKSTGGLAIDASGRLYIADSGNHRVRAVVP